MPLFVTLIPIQKHTLVLVSAVFLMHAMPPRTVLIVAIAIAMCVMTQILATKHTLVLVSVPAFATPMAVRHAQIAATVIVMNAGLGLIQGTKTAAAQEVTVQAPAREPTGLMMIRVMALLVGEAATSGVKHRGILTTEPMIVA